jgi:hypothetical protein
MRRIMVASIVAISLVWSAVPAMALTPVKVIGAPGNQYWPSSNGTYLAWTIGSNVYVKALPSGTPRRVNPRGTGGEQASFVGSSNVLVYDQWSVGTLGDVYFYDVSTGTRTKAPAAVNKPGTWEWAAMASDNYLMFMRSKASLSGRLVDRRLLLYDRHTGVMRTLASGVSRYYRPTFAGMTYVAWTTSTWVGFTARDRYTIHYWSAGGGMKVQPSVPRRDQHAGTIDEATGQIYYIRSKTAACDSFVTIRRSMLGSSASTVLASLPAGIDTGETMSLAPNITTSHQDLYFVRYSCRADTSDIYALRGVDTV